jgi:choline-glycine betaine transporter
MAILPIVFLLFFFVFLFVREIEQDKKRFRETKRLANEHVLKEVERFLKDKAGENK